MHAVGCNSRYPRFSAALKALRGYPRRSAHRARYRAHQRGGADFDLTRRAEDRRIRVRRRRQMDGHRLKCSHLPDHALFRATRARYSGPDRPHARNLIEVPGRASGVRHRPLAAEFVQAVSLAMAFVAKRGGEPASVKVSAARAVLMNHAVVGKARTAELIQFGQSSHGYVLQNHGQQVVGIWRAARQINNWFSGNYGIDADRARGIR